MSLTIDLIWGFACVFARISTLLLVAPLLGSAVPVKIRVMLSAVIALALEPTLSEALPGVPADLLALGLGVGREILIGAILGMTLQLLLMAAQSAGTIMDLQLGFGSLQLYNPMFQGTTTLLGQFQFTFALVVFFSLGGHHLALHAFVQSYWLNTTFDQASLTGMTEGLVRLAGQLALLSMQMAAPVAAVSVIVDAAASIVNKSIPQMQVFFLTAGIKSIIGIVVLGTALPLMVSVMRAGIEQTLAATMRILGGG